MEKQKAQEAFRNKLDLKIYYKNTEKTLHLLRSNTLQEMFERIWFEFSLFNESIFSNLIDDDKEENDEESSIKNEKNPITSSGNENDNNSDNNNKNNNNKDYNNDNNNKNKNNNNDNNNSDNNNVDNFTSETNKSEKVLINHTKTEESSLRAEAPSSIVQYHEMRLRYFNIATKIPTDVFDISSRTKTLESLGFSSYRYLMLQTKEKNEIWEEYHSDGFNILLEGFDSLKNDFCPVRSVRMAKNSTLKDLRKMIGPWVNYPASEIR